MTKVGACVALILAAFTFANAQGGRGQAAANVAAKASAPVDLTGYWITIVTEVPLPTSVSGKLIDAGETERFGVGILPVSTIDCGLP